MRIIHYQRPCLHGGIIFAKETRFGRVRLMIHVETERLILRTWQESDHEPFAVAKVLGSKHPARYKEYKQDLRRATSDLILDNTKNFSM